MRNAARLIAANPYGNITINSPHAFYGCHDGTGTTLAARSGSTLGDQTIAGTTTDIWSNPGWLTFNSAGTNINDTTAEALSLGDLSSKSTGLLIACTLYIGANPSSASEHVFSYGNTAATSNGWFLELNSAGKIRPRAVAAGGDAGGVTTATVDTTAVNTMLAYFDVANGLIHKALNLNGVEADSGPAGGWPTADDTGRGLGIGTKITVASTYSQQLNSYSSGAQMQSALILAPSSDIVTDLAAMATDINRHPWELARVFNGV